MPVVLGGNQLDTAAYDVSNSLRFNDNDSAYLSREFVADPTSRKTFTISLWVKRGNLSSNQTIIGGSTTSNFYDKLLGFRSTDTLEINNVASGSDAIQVITNQLFRDVSAWYHIVAAIDTTQSSISDGIKLYINGVRYTDYDGTPVYNQNATFEVGRSGSTTSIGRLQVNSTQYYHGYFSDINYIDGQQKAQTDFGEFNDNGVWIPKQYSGSYGNNGFFLEFKQTGGGTDSSGRGADTSGNDEHFANNNFDTYDTTTDTCTNNFATLSPLSNGLQASYQEGNLEETCNDNFGCGATQSFANGKWYWELKVTAGDYNIPGVANSDEQYRFPDAFAINNYSITYYGLNGVIYKEGSTNQSTGTTFGANDIIGLAVDMDSGTRTVQFYKNGSTVGSAVTLPTNWIYTVPMIRKGGSSQTTQFNFGNPPFSISSGNSDANGYGNFEYAVPSGYYALCTKNLAEYG